MLDNTYIIWYSIDVNHGSDGLRSQEQFLKVLSRLWPVAKGSLARVRRSCVRRGCRACARGEKHPAWIFVHVEKGRRRCLYVPESLAPVMREAIRNGRRVEAWLKEAGLELILSHRRRRKGLE